MCGRATRRGNTFPPEDVEDTPGVRDGALDTADWNVSLRLAKLEAIDGGGGELLPEHLMLGIAQHPLWGNLLQEAGISHTHLRELLGEKASAAPKLTLSADVRFVLRRARELCGGEEQPPCGLHLLEATLTSDLPVARLVRHESRTPIRRAIRKWQNRCPTFANQPEPGWLGGIGRAMLRSLPAYYTLLAASCVVLLLGVVVYTFCGEAAAWNEWFTNIVGGTAFVIVGSFPIVFAFSALLGLVQFIKRRDKATNMPGQQT